MDNRTTFKSNRKLPTPATVIDDVRNHTLVLQALVEAINTGSRHTKNVLDSFVRVQELVDLGLIELEGNTLKVIGSSVSASGSTAVWGGITGTLSNQSDLQTALNGKSNTGHTHVQLARQVGAAWSSSSALVAADCKDVYVRMPVAGTITGAYIFTQGGTGTCVIDIWNDTYANFPPTVADTITASAKPTVASGIKSSDTTLTGWDKALVEGDILVFHVDSTSTFTGITIYLTYAPT